MSGLDISQEGLNVLCIDSGGVRGLSALVLLEEIMKRMQTSRKLDFPPDPHQCFDVIAGTGTGGVQACMLGRLRMPVRPAIESYANLVKDVFSEKKRLGSGSFKTTKLKNSLRSIIRDATGDPEELMIEGKTMERQCKTLVFAMSSQNMRAGIPTTFRSYPIAANEGPKCTIWETLCATMVHPDLFKSFVIGGPLLNQSFVDGGLRCNNPLAYVLAEVKRIYPKRYVASITSIGMGHTRTIQIPNTVILRRLLPIAAIVAMKEIATDAERVAEDMARRFNSTEDVYFRLSVDQGMQNLSMDRWEQLNEVLEHTRTYMKLVDVSQRIDKLVQAIHSRKPIVPVVQIDGEIQITTASTSVGSMIRRCPAPTPIFTGCEFKLREIELCITGSITERKVCVVHGLGGAGKTQMVLKVIERTYNQWKEVIYVDASTEESIENALKDFAQIKKVGGTYQDGLGWLELHREPWLVVFDNADSPLLRLRNYMPRTSHGSVIITTRLSGMVSFAQGKHSDCSVSSMEPDDALALLLKSARKQDQELPPEEMEAANALLKELGHFALAIVHAGSFVGQSPHMSITEYKYLFMEGRQRALEAYNKSTAAVKIDDYEHTVYTAWLMCYEQLRLRAQELLWLIAYLHHTGITVDIFRRAATNILSYKPRFPTTLLEDSARQKLKEFLASFLDASYQWDGLLFSESINEIVSHSLLEYDRTNESYRIHVLVQSWVRTIMPWDADLAVECTRTLLSISIPTDNSLSSIMFRTSVGLHVDMALSGTSDKISANHALEFFMVYRERGQWKQAKQLGLQMRETSERVLGNDHPDTLSTMHNLALTYSNLNRLDEARDLQVQVLDAWKRVLGDDHPDTLKTMHNLAATYSKLNRLDEARDLEVQVLDARKRVLGDDHPHTLKTMHNLALTYSNLNRLDEARDLEVQVLDARKRVLGDDHPHTLKTMHNLAHTYLGLGLWEEAEKLQINVDKFVQVFGQNDERTCAARNQLRKIQGYREKHTDGSS
ncbi:hypothetical protein OPQ81_007309 [Rhizoctonia solani]|nr:hypothetical protein OPQ81_007309 [Rhizoctonia solani]